MHDNWMLTYPTGTQFRPLNPDPADIHIEDIAHHLSMICRFSGAVCRHYSVAEHSLYVAKLAWRHDPEDTTLQLQALLHDASEAYLGDVIYPIKCDMTAYRRYERHLQRMIYRVFDLPEDVRPEVKLFDRQVLATEKSVFCAPHDAPWKILDGVTPARLNLLPWFDIDQAFLRAYDSPEIYLSEVDRCRVCGCTDEDCSGCIERTGQPCHWVNDEHTLCSACAGKEITDEH